MQKTIVAKVRSRDAIGIFYNETFTVFVEDGENWKDKWFKTFGLEWELDHFISCENWK